MPSPVTPAQIREAIPSVTGNFCERFLKSLTLPKLWHQIAVWMMTEDGEINPDGMGADICALTCFGGSGSQGGTGTTFGFPQNVVATDGLFTDKVRVTWNQVFSATAYDVYRNTVNNASTATLIGTTANLSFEDTTGTAGVNYFYWVRARSTTQTSTYSVPDQGYRSAVMAAVTDLAATKGYSKSTNPFISLVFTPVPTATEYDFYISDSNDFSTASLLDSGRSPFDNSESFNFCAVTPCSQPVFIDNDGELVYIYQPSAVADQFIKKYFWVIAKTVSSGLVTAMTPESNAAEGWAIGNGDGVLPLSDNISYSGEAAVDTPAGATEAWVALYGSGAGGAGGDGDNAGGGGGGGAMVVGLVALAAGSKLRVVSTPESDTTNAAASTHGQDGARTVVEYSADGTFTDTVEVLVADQAAGGQFLNGGNGVGGSGANGSVDASVTESDIQVGRNGLPANGTSGGRGGQRFGNTRKQGAHWNGFAVGTDNGDGATFGAGGGSYASPGIPASATGGKGIRGYAIMIYRT